MPRFADKWTAFVGRLLRRTTATELSFDIGKQRSIRSLKGCGCCGRIDLFLRHRPGPSVPRVLADILGSLLGNDFPIPDGVPELRERRRRPGQLVPNRDVLRADLLAAAAPDALRRTRPSEFTRLCHIPSSRIFIPIRAKYELSSLS